MSNKFDMMLNVLCTAIHCWTGHRRFITHI